MIDFDIPDGESMADRVTTLGREAAWADDPRDQLGALFVLFIGSLVLDAVSLGATIVLTIAIIGWSGVAFLRLVYEWSAQREDALLLLAMVPLIAIIGVVVGGLSAGLLLGIVSLIGVLAVEYLDI